MKPKRDTRQFWCEYEQFKQQLRARNLSPEEYECAVIEWLDATEPGVTRKDA
jgi:hypothetical protein